MMLKKILVFASLLSVVIIGYGYWHVSTYGWLHLSIRDVSGQGRQYKLIKDAAINLLDSDGKVLARGKSDNLHGVVYLAHPEVGSCVDEERRAQFSKESRQDWYDCYQKQATWIVKWVRDVRYLDIEFADCVLKKVPVSVSETKGDWLWWWVPLPHIGGKPSTFFSINVQVDSAECRVTGPQ